MGGGLMELVAKGAQDIFLTGNPNVTYFKTIFKRHTNFSMESIQQSFSGDLNFGKRISSTIKRTGDLLSGITIEMDLPALSGKYDSDNGGDIEWCNPIGYNIIDYVEIEIGGNIIDRQYGEWMDIWSELTTSDSHMNGLKNMVGKGLLTHGIEAGEARKIIIPLQFWFCKNIGLALPLVSLQYHEVKLYVNLKPFNQCWKKPFNKYLVEVDISNGSKLNITSSETLTLNKIRNGLTVIWEDSEEVVSIISSDSTSITVSNSFMAGRRGYIYVITNEPDKEYTLDDVRLYCDYIYLDTNERKFFAQNTHIYLIEQVQFSGNIGYQYAQESSKIPLDFNHPCKELIWLNQMNITKNLNDNLNFSDSLILTSCNNPVKDTLLYLNGQ